MSVDISTALSSQSSIQSLVDQYMAIEARPQQQLEEKKETLTTRKKTLTELDSSLSALRSKADELLDPTIEQFNLKSGKSSDSEKFIVTADAAAEIGNHSISVERMAIADTRVSKQVTDDASDFTDILTDQVFSIEIANPTEEDSENRISIDITIAADQFQNTNADLLDYIATTINAAMSSAVAADTVNIDEVVRASVVSEVDGSSRIVIRSNNSGYDYRMDFSDSADNLLGRLEANQAAAVSGSSGGYITEVGTSRTNSLLNAKLNVDGLTFYRNENVISDVLGGISIQVLDTFSTTESITVDSDVYAVKDEVNAFLDTYNTLVNFLRDNVGINATSGEYGSLSNDLKYRGILYDLRDIMISEVDGVSNSLYSRLSTIGIRANRQGVLAIQDNDKFNNALRINSNYVADLFNQSDNGIATQLKNYITDYVEGDGIINTSKLILDEQIVNLEDRIADFDDYLDNRAAELQKEFGQLQQAMSLLNSQQSVFSMFSNIS